MKEKPCIYIARSDCDNILAFSPDMEYLFLYLETFYKINDDEKIPINISREFDEEKIEKIYIEYEEYQLIEILPKIIVTSWEHSIWDEYFHEYYDNTKNLIFKNTKRQLEMIIGEEPTDEDVVRRMKKIFGQKYIHISTYEHFIGYLGRDQIQNLLNDKILRYEYELNKEFSQRFSSDI